MSVFAIVYVCMSMIRAECARTHISINYNILYYAEYSFIVLYLRRQCKGDDGQTACMQTSDHVQNATPDQQLRRFY